MSDHDGVRLLAVELLNWGTFHRHVWRFDVGGGNALLTGQVGAGKSTLADGLSILLNAPSQVSFNLAAGADRRERTLRSYVLGAYRNVEDELTGGARPDYLRRPAGTLSAVLAVFGASDGRRVSLGILLRFANDASTPTWQYLLADRELSISRDLTGHKDVRELRSSLRAKGVQLYDEFKSYRTQLCRKLRLTPAALALFAQTVSMKSVGNLTTFVRTHMLDAPDIDGLVSGMLAHYADLTAAHDRVVDAREQVGVLDRVHEQSRRLDEADASIDAAERALAGVQGVVDCIRAELLRAAIDTAQARLPGLGQRKERVRGRLEEARSRRSDLDFAIRSAGGSDLALAAERLHAAKAAYDAVVSAARELDAQCRAVGVDAPAATADFPAFREELTALRAELAQQSERLTVSQGRVVSERTAAADALAALDRELEALSTRPSNIPVDEARLRDRIADDLGLRSEDLPFAGELLAVAEGQSAWEAAAERLARPLALSLLVAEESYREVSDWVDRHHLGLRLVYQRVPAGLGREARRVDPRTVAGKLTIRPGTRFSGWLAEQVARRYDHVCVDDAAGLARHERAVTRSGLVRDGDRHEKDDRHRAGERRHYVLGWDTRAKRQALAEARGPLLAAREAADAALNSTVAEVHDLRRREVALDVLDQRFRDPAAIDIPAAAHTRDDAQRHHDELVNDPELARLVTRRDEVDEEIAGLRREEESVVGDIARTEDALERHTRDLAGLSVPDPDPDPAVRRHLDDARRAAGPRPGEVGGCDAYQRVLTDRITASVRSLRGARSTALSALIAAQGEYANRWPAAVKDIAVTEESGRHDLAALRTRLRKDDLPRFEDEFRHQLETNAINEIAVFSRRLEQSSRAIAGRIETINGALADISYRSGTYIALTVEPTKDQFVREFRAQLREVTEDTVGSDEAYSEARFLRVRDLLDRFAGRQDSSEEDRRWRRRVVDVRNWHTFAASERSRDDDTLVEHYADSDGKSGGQKEKLAYTVLAASLAYQYGLASDTPDAFRFVMIDEAFGRGSDESTRFALDLFSRLGLQVLVITPLQKIATIERYVDAVGYVAQPDQMHSRLLSMTISEFRARRAERARTLAAARDEAGEEPESEEQDTGTDAA